MKKSTLLLAVAVAAVASGLLLNDTFWDKNRAALLVALSVIAAGTLVRLARGLPFTTPDLYELGEIRQLTQAVSGIMRKLRLLLVIIVGTMLLLIVLFPLVAFLSKHLGAPSHYLDIGASALLGAMHAYAFSRMYQVVCGDEDLTALQSDFIEKAVARKQGEKFTKAGGDEPIASSVSNYGRRLDNGQ